MKTRIDFTCPLELTHDITKGKWKPIILWQLGKSNYSLSKLEKDIKGISQKMLLEQLKELQEFDLVGKNEFSGYPLKVEYFITVRGLKMLEAVKIMQEIGIEIMLENGMEDTLKKLGLLLENK
jgi:DNA-binding HxlR family transcriptional regulator